MVDQIRDGSNSRFRHRRGALSWVIATLLLVILMSGLFLLFDRLHANGVHANHAVGTLLVAIGATLSVLSVRRPTLLGTTPDAAQLVGIGFGIGGVVLSFTANVLYAIAAGWVAVLAMIAHRWFVH